MRPLLTILVTLTALATFAQDARLLKDTNRPLEKRLIIKTNLLSVIARRPTVSVEKVFSNRLSAELGFVQGQFNNILFTDRYQYSGFLARVKKYMHNFDFGEASPFLGAYVGNLRRNIQTGGDQLGNSGWIGYPSRIFSANSIRAGGTLGLSYISRARFVVEGLGSLGYGRYLNLDKSDPDTYMDGYLDLQVWLSVGFCF